MKIAVIGATGATGQRVVARALAQGHAVTAVARHPDRLAPAERLSLARGDVVAPGGLDGVLEGMDAVISCIGPEKNFSPGTLMSVGIANILAECKRANVARFVMQSGIGLSDGREFSLPNRLAMPLWHLIFRAAIADKASAERMTEKYAKEWVIVRPVGLLNRPAKGHYTAGPLVRVAPFLPLAFDDCADCLLRAATGEPGWVGKIVNAGP